MLGVVKRESCLLRDQTLDQGSWAIMIDSWHDLHMPHMHPKACRTSMAIAHRTGEVGVHKISVRPGYLKTHPTSSVTLSGSLLSSPTKHESDERKNVCVRASAMNLGGSYVGWTGIAKVAALS
jgi:hypothetical protein